MHRTKAGYYKVVNNPKTWKKVKQFWDYNLGLPFICYYLVHKTTVRRLVLCSDRLLCCWNTWKTKVGLPKYIGKNIKITTISNKLCVFLINLFTKSLIICQLKKIQHCYSIFSFLYVWLLAHKYHVTDKIKHAANNIT